MMGSRQWKSRQGILRYVSKSTLLPYKWLECFSWDEMNGAPDRPGLYFIYVAGKLKYLGQSKEIKNRVRLSEFLRNVVALGYDTKEVRVVTCCICVDPQLRRSLESALIAKLKPEFGHQ